MQDPVNKWKLLPPRGSAHRWDIGFKCSECGVVGHACYEQGEGIPNKPQEALCLILGPVHPNGDCQEHIIRQVNET